MPYASFDEGSSAPVFDWSAFTPVDESAMSADYKGRDFDITLTSADIQSMLQQYETG